MLRIALTAAGWLLLGLLASVTLALTVAVLLAS